MAIFGSIKVDSCIALNDKFRIDASFTWATPDEPDFNSVEIEPFSGHGYIDVTSDRFLDWAYTTPGQKTITLRIMTNVGVQQFTKTVDVKTEEQDCCLANDECLRSYEPDICKWLPCERTSYKWIHRKVATCIVDCINRMGVSERKGYPVDPKNPICKLEPITCDQLKNNPQIEKWATFWALELILSSMSARPDDIFAEKAEFYRSLAKDAGNAPNLYIDFDGDGQLERSENISWFRPINYTR